jgi:DNA repair exonuclease SbcCD ATPase subunit
MVGLRRSLFGYSPSSVQALLADRELMFERATRDAQSAEERAERVASELSETARRLVEADERSATAQDLGEKLAADLERSVEEREAMQSRMTTLQDELAGTHAALAAAQAQIAARDAELRKTVDRESVLEAELADHRRRNNELVSEAASARETTAALREEMRQRNELLVKAESEASNAQVWLRRAMEESAEYKRSLGEEQARISELEDLLSTYRAELEERAGAPHAERGGETTAGPTSARELATVLQVTEEAVVRIMESTKARADEELRNVDRDRERIGREVEAMTSWRDRAAPMISTLLATMDEVVAHANELGVRVDEVLRPVTGAVTRLGSQLSSLDALSLQPPSAKPASGDEGAQVIELRDDQTSGREAGRDH